MCAISVMISVFCLIKLAVAAFVETYHKSSNDLKNTTDTINILY